MRILIVDQNVTRASILEAGLREAGYRDVTVQRDMQYLMRRILDLDPDAIFIDLENPNRDVLEQMFQVSRSAQRPIAMFVDRSDFNTDVNAHIRAANSSFRHLHSEASGVQLWSAQFRLSAVSPHNLRWGSFDLRQHLNLSGSVPKGHPHVA